MARIRTVKPTIWGDAKFAGLSRDARLLVIGLISAADDSGRFIASAAAIAGSVYPHDDLSPTQIRKWRQEVADAGLISLYKVDGREYGYFPRWGKHQKINRPQASSLPCPPGVPDAPPPPPPPDPPSDSDEDVNHSLNGHGTTHDQITGGMEGIGREGNAAAAAVRDSVNDAAAAAIDDLRDAARAAGMTARWDKLSPDHRRAMFELHGLHGVDRLIDAARRVSRPDDPAKFAQAWLPHWQALPPPGQRVRAVVANCPEHHLPAPCISCAADLKAAQ